MHAESNKRDDKLHVWQSRRRLKLQSPCGLFIMRRLQISCDTIKTGTQIASAYIWRLHLNSSGGLASHPASTPLPHIDLWRSWEWRQHSWKATRTLRNVKKMREGEVAALSHLCSKVSWWQRLQLRVCTCVCCRIMGEQLWEGEGKEKYTGGVKQRSPQLRLISSTRARCRCTRGPSAEQQHHSTMSTWTQLRFVPSHNCFTWGMFLLQWKNRKEKLKEVIWF